MAGRNEEKIYNNMKSLEEWAFAGIPQKEMAEICGLKMRSYQQYEYAENYPTVPGLVFLADYFGVSLDYLMGRKDERE